MSGRPVVSQGAPPAITERAGPGVSQGAPPVGSIVPPPAASHNVSASGDVDAIVARLIQRFDSLDKELKRIKVKHDMLAGEMVEVSREMEAVWLQISAIPGMAPV